jgi:hypothetical protein
MCASDAATAYNVQARRESWPSLCDHSLAFCAPELIDLVSLWRSFGQESAIPARAQFSPHVLKPHLRNVSIYERVRHESGARTYRVRLMGSSMTEVLGNLTGQCLEENIRSSFLPRWYAALDATLEAQAPLRFLARSDTNHMEFLVAEYFSAPMRGPDGSVNMVLGSGQYDGARPWPVVESEARRILLGHTPQPDLDAMRR